MKYPTTQQGFSLVETFVAITILLIIMVGPMTISSTTAKSTSFASEQVVAFFLAQEGLELAQKARDDLLLGDISGGGNLLDQNIWPDVIDTSGGTFQNCYSSSGCALEVTKDTVGTVNIVDDCNPSSNCRLYDSGDPEDRARYTHDNSGTITPFTRSIKFSYDPSTQQEIRVISEVSWRTGSLQDEQKVVLETYLTNIYE